MPQNSCGLRKYYHVNQAVVIGSTTKIPCIFNDKHLIADCARDLMRHLENCADVTADRRDEIMSDFAVIRKRRKDKANKKKRKRKKKKKTSHHKSKQNTNNKQNNNNKINITTPSKSLGKEMNKISFSFSNKHKRNSSTNNNNKKYNVNTKYSHKPKRNSSTNNNNKKCNINTKYNKYNNNNDSDYDDDEDVYKNDSNSDSDDDTLFKRKCANKQLNDNDWDNGWDNDWDNDWDNVWDNNCEYGTNEKLNNNNNNKKISYTDDSSSNDVAYSPPNKKRKLNSSSSKNMKINCNEKDIGSYFQRAMNPQNYNYSQIKFYKWVSGLKIETFDAFINEDLFNLFGFLCKDYEVKLRKEDFESGLAKFKGKLHKAVNYSFKHKTGVLVVRYDECNDSIETWCAIVDGPVIFMNYCSTVPFCYNNWNNKDIDNDIELDQHSNHPFDDIISKLKSQGFTILGVKLSSACTEHDDIYTKMVELCKHHHIILIANIPIKIKQLIKKILNIDCIDEIMRKAQQIILFINDSQELKEQILKHWKKGFPTEPIDFVNFILKYKTYLKKAVRKMDKTLMNKHKTIIEDIQFDITLFDDIKLLGDLFERFTVFRDSVDNSALNWSVGEIHKQCTELYLFYYKSKFSCYNNWQFKNDEVKPTIVNGIKDIFVQRKANETIFQNDSALYYLCGLINPDERVTGAHRQIKDANTLLLSFSSSLSESKSFENMFIDVRSGLNVFSKLEWKSWEMLYGSEYGTFAKLGKSLCSVSGLSVDSTLSIEFTPNVIDRFCYYNSKINVLFSDGMIKKFFT